MEDFFIGTPVDLFVFEPPIGEYKTVNRNCLVYESDNVIYHMPAVKAYSHVLNSMMEKILIPQRDKKNFYPYIYDFRQAVDLYLKRRRMVKGAQILSQNIKYLVNPSKVLSTSEKECSKFYEKGIISNLNYDYSEKTYEKISILKEELLKMFEEL